jgi:putative cobalt transporter subunit CbtB
MTMRPIQKKGSFMERSVASGSGVVLSEPASFLVKSGIFLLACGAILYVLLAAGYPAVHDALHNFRHALAVVPCH